ncbi:hypothetical protein JTB14_021872 [Gonioctena quinquepunctata]|nr:hypothetical protein JTB14_021872 [Gonioctena quinquepunctata]
MLIGDNLASHVSINVIQECQNNNIRFVLLPPNSTHLTQPPDVCYFRPVEGKWRSVSTKWKQTQPGPIRKDLDFLQKKIITKNTKSNKYELSSGSENEDLIEEESSDIEPKDEEPSDIEPEDNLQMRNQDNKPVERHKFRCGEFILVKFNTKKRVVKYVGEICQVIDEEYLQVKFLGKTVGTKRKYFSFPDIIDESMNITDVFGGLRRDEMVKMTVDDIEDREAVLLIKVPETKTCTSKSFTIVEESEIGALNLVKKYIALRPKGCKQPVDTTKYRVTISYSGANDGAFSVGLAAVAMWHAVIDVGTTVDGGSASRSAITDR